MRIEWMFELKKYEGTLIAFKKLVEKFPFSKEEKEKIFPKVADLLEKIAISYDELQRKDEAAMFWKYYADVSFYFKNFKTCGSIGNNLMRKYYRLPEARDCFLKSIRIAPDSGQNLSQLGCANYKLQRWEECMIYSSRAFSIKKDPREERQYVLCQQEHESNPEVYNFSKIEDLLDMAVIEELRGEKERAIKCCSNAFAMLDEQQFQDEADIPLYKFVGDAFWALGKNDNALEAYKKVKEIATGYEKMMAEEICYLLKKSSTAMLNL